MARRAFKLTRMRLPHTFPAQAAALSFFKAQADRHGWFKPWKGDACTMGAAKMDDGRKSNRQPSFHL